MVMAHTPRPDAYAAERVAAAAGPSGTSADASAAWLGFAVFTVVLVGLILLARFLLRRLRFHVGRPHLRENASAYPSGAHSSAPLPCRFTTTPSGIVVKPGTTWRILRGRSRWNRPVALLLGQGQGNVASRQDLARRIPQPHGRGPLVVQFRQTRLPLVWQLWGSLPARGVAIGAGYRGPAHLAPQTASWSPNTTGRRGVLHLVGTPVSTAAGWRLRIPAGASSPAGHRAPSRSLHVDEELVGADDLVVASTALVVLQSEPVDGRPHPLGERYQGVCALAADIRDAGAGAVLVVPPLPDALAHSVATRVRTAMTRRRHRTHPVHVLDLAQAIKDDIALAEQPAGGSSRASRDVLLFA